jgi:hypothetical protein
LRSRDINPCNNGLAFNPPYDNAILRDIPECGRRRHMTEDDPFSLGQWQRPTLNSQDSRIGLPELRTSDRHDGIVGSTKFEATNTNASADEKGQGRQRSAAKTRGLHVTG